MVHISAVPECSDAKVVPASPKKRTLVRRNFSCQIIFVRKTYPIFYGRVMCGSQTLTKSIHLHLSCKWIVNHSMTKSKTVHYEDQDM